MSQAAIEAVIQTRAAEGPDSGAECERFVRFGAMGRLRCARETNTRDGRDGLPPSSP